MANQTSMFKLGLFVLVGFLLLAGGIIWVSTSGRVQGTQNYVTYFAESIQGVQVDSQVKYQGIDVGRVTQINVAPDPHLIEVVLSIKAERSLSGSVMAGIAMVGITGLAYIELVPQDAATVAKSPKVDFPTPYPLIPSYTRGLQQVIHSVGTTLQHLSTVDFEGLSKQTSQLLARAQSILDSQEVRGTLAAVHQTSKNLEAFSASLNRMIQRSTEEHLVDRLINAATSINEMATSLKAQVEDLNLGRLGQDAGQYITDLRESLGQFSQHLNYIAENLVRVSENLERLSERLANSPSDALFSQPPQPLPQERTR